MNKKETILVVDDTTINLDIAVELLGEKYEVAVAMSGERAINIAQKGNIDLILLDIMMPEMDGYETCRKLKEDDKTKDIPVIFITAKSDEDSIEKGFDIGGVDYVSKPFKHKELLARVKTHIELKKVQNILVEQNIKLENLAVTDNLTELYNRLKLDECVYNEISRSKRFNHQFGVAMIDIDNFKSVNDTYGHQIGDKVLVEIAQIIKNNLRETDIAGRWGGEEFLLIMPETDEDGFRKVIETIRELIEVYDFSIIGNKTASFGITMYEKGDTLESLIKKADDALYQAKRDGKNKVIML